ncbi:hypothetical protein G7Y79_00005g016430 [Physcia stellaris]|nr:hypothetical protein G7Y79_00005g016430 [Physcia stellaris]
MANLQPQQSEYVYPTLSTPQTQTNEGQEEPEKLRRPTQILEKESPRKATNPVASVQTLRSRSEKALTQKHRANNKLTFWDSRGVRNSELCVNISDLIRVQMSTSCQNIKSLHRRCVLILCNHSSSTIGPIVIQRGEVAAHASLTFALATWGSNGGLQVRDDDCGVSHLAAVGV